MASVAKTLERLTTTFAVRDIMVRAKDLACATDEAEAVLVSSNHPDFSFVPIMLDGKFTAYYNRDSCKVEPIAFDDLISDGTGLLDLIKILEYRQFAFVVGDRQIEGYVHFSDLNHHLMKLTMYVLLEALERFALVSLEPVLTCDYLRKELGAIRFQQVEGFYKRSGDAGQSIVNYLNIADVLKLASKVGTIHLNEDVIKAMKCKRDAAAHVLEDLVSNYEDVAVLAEVKRECLRILSGAYFRRWQN